LKFDICADPDGNIYIAEQEGRIRRIVASTGFIEDFAGSSTLDSTGDGGTALQATFNSIGSLAFSANSRALYVCEKQGNRIRRIGPGPDFIVSTVAGGVPGTSQPLDGKFATQVPVDKPTSICVDTTTETVYVALNVHHYIFKFRIGDLVVGVAGTYDLPGFNGEGVRGRDALLNSPFGVTLDPSGNLIVADQLNARVRRIDAKTTIVSTLIGNGAIGRSRDGTPLDEVRVRLIEQVVIDPQGNIYVPDRKNQAIFRFHP
jgi:sugar lactone lactonase YvrE